jgi:uncharacterized OB-fold protein
MSQGESRDGIVYTETIVYSPPEQYAADIPYQLAILDLDRGGRLTARILGKEPQQRAHIGDRVTFVEDRGGVSYYRKADTPSAASDLSESDPVLS